MPQEPAFEVASTVAPPSGTHLVIGIADPTVASLSAADQLVTQAEATQIGHIRTRHLPDITPFTEGDPRHPIRIYAVGDDITVVVSEVFLPVWVADAFADVVSGWATDAAVEDVTILNGGTFPHGEEQHVLFQVSTTEYEERYFGTESDVTPLPGGFFDGVVGELMLRGLDGDLPPCGTLVTPVHQPGPDFDAALRLLDGVEAVLGITVDETELQRRAEELRRHHEELAKRIQTMRESEEGGSRRDFPNDRMYM